MKKNVLISGGSGFIGRHLTALLIAKGYSVSILSRSEKQNKENVFYYKWDVVNQTIDEKAVLNADFIIHLAGENIAEQRWTAKRKAAIIDSREQSTLLLYSVLRVSVQQVIASLQTMQRIKTFFSYAFLLLYFNNKKRNVIYKNSNIFRKNIKF